MVDGPIADPADDDHGEPREDRDDRDHDHDFQQGETPR
jgi:hypothetical protein